MNEEYISEFDVAVIGMACRFPKAKNIKQYWGNLVNGVNSTHFASDEELRSKNIPLETINDNHFIKASVPLEDIEQFDANFFQMSPSDAMLMDPQIRGLLQTSWHTLEDAGYDSFKYQGAIGNFCSMGTGEYHHMLMESAPELAGRNPLQTRILNEKDFIATQISYKLNLKGPAMSVQTACSSSLLAVHLACQSLLSNECDMALAGGAQVDSSGALGYYHTEGSILSPDGYCRAFDKDAQGIIPGNGIGMVLLKKLSNAIEDGDNIYAVIKGSAVNNDGADKMAYTAPSIESQRNVILEALSVGEVNPDTVELLEAHGTGTNLGDPVEVTALKEAFGQSTARKNFCALGSVKTNIGHLDCAAGIASFIKAALCVHHGEIVESLNCKNPNPALELDESPFYVSQERKSWASHAHPRRAGISSFGVGGTNVHVVIEHFDSPKSPESKQSHYFIPLSAKTQKSLSDLKAQLAHQLETDPSLEIADIAHTLTYGRHHFDHRFSAVCQSKEELFGQLSNTLKNEVIERKSAPRQSTVVFMYTGQGSQYADMALDLYKQSTAFKEHLEHCFLIADNYLPHPLKSYLFGDNQRLLGETNISQIAIFSVEYSLTKLWEAWGIQPQAVLGHSLGEFTAAVTAGVMSLEEAIMLVCHRGELMSKLPPGDMISVNLAEANTQNLLCDGVVIAAINGEQQTVLSGDETSINNQKQILLSNGLSFKELKTSHAFHSPMMEAMLEPFKEKLASVKFSAPSLPFISTLTGKQVERDELCSPQYWLDQIINPVQFDTAIRTASGEFNNGLFIEIGPGNTLCSLTKSILQNPRVAFASLPHREATDSEFKELSFLRSQLWHANVPHNKTSSSEHSGAKIISLLGTVFDTQSYWFKPSNEQSNSGTLSPSDSFNGNTTFNSEHPNTLSLGLEIIAPEAGLISETQTLELERIQQEFSKNVSAILQNSDIKINPLLAQSETAFEVENEAEGEINNDANTYAERLTDTEYVAPSSEIEISLTNMWQPLLGYQPVGINDNFFAVGGDSLTATTLLKNINTEFELSLSFKDIAESQTISDLAKSIDLRLWLQNNSSQEDLSNDTEKFEI